jgi:cytoskeleton-associated protein 5
VLEGVDRVRAGHGASAYFSRAFGVPALGNVKPLLKALPKIFGHSDKNVRAEGTSLTIVLYTFLGPALLPALADLKPMQMTDLQKSFDARDAEGKGAGSGKPTRWTRKAQRAREEAAAAGDAGAVEEEVVAIDPMSLLDPVDVSKLFPADLMDRLMSSKWKERLESLEECNKVLADPKNARISDANPDAYGPLAQTLGTKCQKDANVNVVMEAAKLLEGLAGGLGKSFGRFRSVLMTGCLERLKERKAAVVEALGKALDAIFLTVG